MQQPRHRARIATVAMLILTMAGIVGLSGPWDSPKITYADDAGPAAAAISFANPSALKVTVAAGDDFATSVLGDAWDMDVARDLGYEIGFNNISASAGIWSGTYSGVNQASGAATPGYIFPLFQGFSTPISGQLSQELAFTKIGADDRYTINAAKYTRLSYRMSVSPRSNSSPMAVYWTTAKPVTWPAGENRFAQADTCGSVPWNGWHIYNFDMSQPNGDPAARAGSWQGAVRGLRIDPSAAGAAGTQVKIDWIRLSDPSSAPTIVIPWTTSDAGANDRVDIYVADNPSGTNAAPIVYGLSASAGQYSLATSILPPGQHYFQLRLQSGTENGCTTTNTTSTWIGPLTVAEAPIITFAKPSMTSGPDYATEVLGNPWDMAASDDIVTPGSPYPETLSEKSFSGGVFSARAIINPAISPAESDSQIWLHVAPNRPINAGRYRYFTVRLKVDMPAGRDINWSVANGWGGRVIWWNTDIQTDGSESKYGTYYEGWRDYSVDLAQAVPPPPLSNPAQADNILTPREQNSFPAQLGWTQLGSVRNLRYDPLETTQPAAGTGADIFSIDWVKLTANDEVKRGQIFRIEAGLNVTPSSLRSITYYYTTSRSQPTQSPALSAAQTAAAPQAGMNTVYLPLVTIPTLNPVVGNALAYNWDTSGVAPGTYYICSVANTGVRTATYCSDTPVVVLP